MAHQSPMISIPKKSTEEVDWTGPIRSLIAQSYGESPDNYAAECASLQRTRQDAVRGAGSDFTARDLLYKYFGQLELLELRFSEIRVNFPWHDAFTGKLIMQTSIAYEKASILFQIAATHSAIASSQSRTDPEGIKRAFYYFKACAGMLTYINENFLHAPSTDLSREVVKLLINVILAQATEVFFDKCADEKKGNALVAKIGSQAAYMYTSLTDEVKEFMGKGIFDRSWVSLIQTKAKYFTSLAQYYKGLADDAAGKHGDALVRFTQAEILAKEASRLASSFSGSFVHAISPTLPADAGSSIVERAKAHLALVSEKKAIATKENDLIYNAILPSFDALPPVEKTAVAQPIPIQEVYGTPEVQKTIGQDLFLRLIPLSVHESASVYSEEKAKLARSEVEKADSAEGEARSALEGMGVQQGLARFRAMAEGELGGESEVPVEVRRWRDDITVIENREGVNKIIGQLGQLKANVRNELHGASVELDTESRECEAMRVKYEHKWTQAPSAGLSKTLRQDLKSHQGSLEAAAPSDQQVITMWEGIRGDIGLLLSDRIEEVFTSEGGRAQEESLLDLDSSNDASDADERTRIGTFIAEIDDRLGIINKLAKERKEVLKDLKEKIQTDDVSHLLLLNRRNSSVEPTLFAAELEKFRPYQQRLAATLHRQEGVLQEIASLWKNLKELAGRGAGARRWEEREKKKKSLTQRFSRARDVYMEVRDGLAKGMQFYNDITELTAVLRRNVRQFVTERGRERETIASHIEIDNRLTAPASRPPVPPPPPKDMSGSFSSLNLGNSSSRTPTSWNPSSPVPYDQGRPQYSQSPNRQYSTPPVPSAPSYSTNYGASSPPPPNTYQTQSYGLPPPPPPPALRSPPPPPPQNDPYSSLGMFGQNTGQQQQPSYQQQQQQYGGPPPPPQQQHSGQYQPPSGYNAFPPPPPPGSYSQGR